MTEVAPLQPLVGTTLGETYRITRLVAVGGMGELYEATHQRLAGRYAVKVLLPQVAAHEEVIARFQREAEITSGLRHPNIVSVIDFNTTPEGRPFLAMEFLEGHDLGTDLAQKSPLALERALEIGDQVVSALSAAHAHGVVHRDLKPQNLFISALPGDGREIVKVLDFGISKMREAHTKLTREHSIMGTPQYMAPEQALGNARAIDHRTDQFSLAAIVYEMLAGQPPFTADSVSAVLYQVVHEQPPPLGGFRPDVPPALERVLRRALAKEPEARFPNIGDFGRALLAAGRGQPVQRGSMALATTMRRTATGHRSRPVTTRGDHRDTTFGASTAQLSNDELMMNMGRPQRSWLPGIAGLLGAAAVIGVVAWVSLRPEDEPAVQASAPARVAAPVAAAPPPAVPRVPPAALAPAPSSAAPATAATAAPITGSEPGLPPAPLRILNAPPDLRVLVDDRPVELPATLPRKPGRYRLRFESPGRPSQSIEVDALAPSHDIRLSMPRTTAARAEETEPEELPPPLPIPAPPEQRETAPAARPSLIEDVGESPAANPPPAQPARVPLIEDP